MIQQYNVMLIFIQIISLVSIVHQFTIVGDHLIILEQNVIVFTQILTNIQDLVIWVSPLSRGSLQNH